MPSLNKIIQIFSNIVLLGVSAYLGISSMHKEMALAILAGSIGLAFSNIDKISEFKGAGFSAKMKEQFETIVEKGMEPERIEIDIQNIPNKVKFIISVFNGSHFTWRSVAGLMRDTGFDRKELSAQMAWLINSGYAKHTIAKPGSMWALTAKGHQLSESLQKNA